MTCVCDAIHKTHETRQDAETIGEAVYPCVFCFVLVCFIESEEEVSSCHKYGENCVDGSRNDGIRECAFSCGVMCGGDEHS